jgi:hypothetical protein
MRRRPSPAMIVALAALVVALGGTGYAASQLPPDSVGRTQLRDGAVGPTKIRTDAVGAQQIRAGAVRSSEVRDHSLRAKDLARGALPAKATSRIRQASGDPVDPGAVGAVSVACAAGERVVGGGGGFAGPAVTNDKLVDSIPVGFDHPPGRWRVTLFNGAASPRTPVAYVVCATP